MNKPYQSNSANPANVIAAFNNPLRNDTIEEWERVQREIEERRIITRAYENERSALIKKDMEQVKLMGRAQDEIVRLDNKRREMNTLKGAKNIILSLMFLSYYEAENCLRSG